MKNNIFKLHNRKEVRKMGKLVLIAMMAVFVASIAYAACTIDDPGAAGVLTGRDEINASCATSISPHNCTLTLTSVSTGLTATVNLTNATSTGNNTLNGTYNTYEVTDGSDYVITGTCYNVSGESETVTSITVQIDNTQPGCTWASGILSKETYAADMEWSATGTNGTAAEIQFGKNPPYVMVESSDNFSYKGSPSSVPEGVFDITITVSDGLNSTSCALSDVRIDIDSTLKQVSVLAASGDLGKKTGGVPENGKLLLMVAIGGAVFWYMRKKK